MPRDLNKVHPYVMVVAHSDNYTDLGASTYRGMSIRQALHIKDEDTRAEGDDSTIYHDVVATSDSPIILHEGL